MLAEAADRILAAAGVAELLVDSPMVEGFFHYRQWGRRSDHGLDGLFPAGPAGFHDGARVDLATATGLLREMLAQQGVWCRLATADGLFLHVGEEGDLYVGGPRTVELPGLAVERVERSPYDPAFDLVEPQRAADGPFWVRLHTLLAERGAVLLEEEFAAHGRRWYRLTTAAEAAEVRAALAPRARLAVWPDLSEDVEAVREAVRAVEGLHLLVRQGADGRFTEVIAERWMGRDGLGHCRAGLVPLERDERRPLLAGVLPDADGTVRARRRANRTGADRRRAALRRLREGEVVTGTVATGLHDIAVWVDLDGPSGEWLGWLRVPEMSWEHFDSLEKVAPVGRRIRAEVLRVDWAFERVELSMKALQMDPWRLFAVDHRLGAALRGTVTKVLPFGIFVRVAPGMEGLLPGHTGEPGEEITVVLHEIDWARRRLVLGPAH